jgi:hypothetical protein
LDALGPVLYNNGDGVVPFLGGSTRYYSLPDIATSGTITESGHRYQVLRSAMSHAARVSRRVLVSMYELGSSSALYTGSALERPFRDGVVALQHANHSAAAFEGVGRVRLGLDPGMPLFRPGPDAERGTNRWTFT